MVDTKKYEQIYQDILQLQPDDTLQLLLEAKTDDEREFYEIIGNFLLQRKQREVIAKNLFQYYKVTKVWKVVDSMLKQIIFYGLVYRGDSMKEIIEKAEMIYAEYENQKKKEGLDYNIFSLLDVERKELETHENMIYNILFLYVRRLL